MQAEEYNNLLTQAVAQVQHLRYQRTLPGTAMERLECMATDSRTWTEPAAIAHAQRWITMVQGECGESWQEPTFVTSVSSAAFGDGELCFTWIVANRQLQIFVREGDTYAWRSQELVLLDAYGENTPEERAMLWRWLLFGLEGTNQP